MTGLTIPHENFFSQKDTSEDFLDTPGPKKTYLGHFSGVSRCMSGVSKKNFQAKAGKFFFDRVNQPP